MAKILIIEDEKNLARFVELELQHENYETVVENNGRKGLDDALSQDFDAILLDLMLPDLNGLEIARRVRQVKTTPIIMMTARDSVIDRVSGLDHGADDYIVKPFAIEELLARLRAVLRRVKIEKDASKVTVAKQKIVKFKDLTIETANRIVHRGDGKAIDLTKREYNLLMTLIENKNNVVSRDQLLNKIWGPESNIETNVVEVYVRYLRNKIDVPGQPSYIKTVRGTGYMVRDEDDDQVIEDFLASLFSESEKLPVVFDPQTDKMLDEYLKSFIALYGLISAQQAYQIIHSQNPAIDKERFDQYIQNKFDEITMEYCIIDFKKEFTNVDIAPEIFIFSPLLIKDENRLPSFYKHQQGMIYYIPEKEVLIDSNFNLFANISNYQQELEELLANQYGLSGDDLKGAAFLSLYQLKMSDYGLKLSSVNDAINKVVAFLNEEHGLSVKQDKANEPLIKILALIATNIRRPWNRGWSNYELLRTKDIAKLVSEMEINLEEPKLSSEIVSGIQVGSINRDELLNFLENSNLPPKVISKLYKQAEEL